MARVSKFEAASNTGPFLVFLYAALNSGGVSVRRTAPSHYPAFFTALCFIAEFSEQLVPDLIHKAERNLSSQQFDVREKWSGQGTG
jgi:hypothetical protein